MAAVPEIATFPLLDTVTISLSHLLWDHWSNIFATCLGCSPGGLVMHAQFFPIRQQIWPPSAILDFSRYRISSITSEGSWGRVVTNVVRTCDPTPLHTCIKILHNDFSQPQDVIATKVIPVGRLIWPPDGNLRNRDFPFT